MKKLQSYRIFCFGGYIETRAYSEKEARSYARGWYGVKRLPNDTWVETYTLADVNRMVEHNQSIGILD